MATSRGVPAPQNGFSGEAALTIGGQRIVSRYFGEAHTKDNIVTWIPSEKILFGGCQVKALGSEKGNLADANVQAWSHTTRKIKKAYRKAKIVVPGHGNVGGTELLDYTIRLFKTVTN